MTVLADLEEFVRDHRQHGQMTGDATEPEWNGYRLTVACACGVVFERWVAPADADADLVRWRSAPVMSLSGRPVPLCGPAWH